MNRVSYERKQKVATTGHLGSQKLTNKSSEISQCHLWKRRMGTSEE